MTSNIPQAEPQQPPVSKQLDEIGAGREVPRQANESDEDYAERLVYELDVRVEELWACQDRIRELVKIDLNA
jgi:hypothetical protein